MAKDIDCRSVSALVSRVKHVLDGQDVGDLELKEPPWVIDTFMQTMERPLGR